MALALLLPLAACASGASPGAMTVPLSAETMIADGSALRQSIATGTVGGGQDTNPLWTSQVSNEAFATALRQSLGTHAMLAIGSERYRLDATLGGLRQPMAGFSMEVTSTVSYRLTALATGSVVFERTIEAAYTAPFNAAFSGVERLRLANEGSVKENIRQFLAALVAEEARNPRAFRPGTPIS